MPNSSTIAKLSELQGLQSAKRIVRSLFQGNSAAHAVLIYGMKGSGKTTLAKLLAKGWMCREPDSDGGCGSCQSCTAMQAEQSVDYLLAAPLGPSYLLRNFQILDRPEDVPEGVYIIHVERFLRTIPMVAKRKVVVLEDVDRLTVDAASSLLKMLEEPPEYARFVLTTSRIGSVRDTIISRCLCLACSMPSGDLPVVEKLERQRRSWLLAEMDRLVEDALAMGKNGALVLAERARKLADRLDDGESLGKRAAYAQVLDYLAEAFLQRHEFQKTQEIAEAHRLILANGSANLVFEALFAGF